MESNWFATGSVGREERVSKGKETEGFVPFGLPHQPCQTPKGSCKPGVWKFQICLAMIGSAAIGPLTNALSDAKRVYGSGHEAAAVALEKIGTEHALESLIAIVGSSESPDSAREHAIRALARLGGRRTVRPLIAVLDDEKYKKRGELGAEARTGLCAAIEALGKSGDPAAVRSIMAFLDNKRFHGCGEIASRAFACIGVPAVQPLITAMGNAPYSFYAKQSLVSIGPPVIEPLIKSLRSAVRFGAAETLDALGWKPSTIEDTAAYCVAKYNFDAYIPGASLVECLVKVLDHSDWKVRVQAARALVDGPCCTW